MSVLQWLDRYIEVDRLNIRPDQVFPRMRWWQWAWYVVALTGLTWAMPTLGGWQDRVLDPVPLLRNVSFLVTWPVFGVAYELGAHVLLPARKARRAAPGEVWLVAAICLAAAAVGWFVDLDFSK